MRRSKTAANCAANINYVAINKRAQIFIVRSFAKVRVILCRKLNCDFELRCIFRVYFIGFLYLQSNGKLRNVIRVLNSPL